MKLPEQQSATEILECLGAKPSISEEHGLKFLSDSDLVVFSPGISTAGFAEIRMAQANSKRHIVATTIDTKGLAFAEDIIKEVGLQDQIETRLEDLRSQFNYPDSYFDFIYARLVLHYLQVQDLEKVLAEFHRTLKPGGKLFTVVRSVKNIPERPDVTYDPETRLTSIPRTDSQGNKRLHVRYFHTPESISGHLQDAGFGVQEVTEYQEQLYRDFMREAISPHKDHVIEVHAVNRIEE